MFLTLNSLYISLLSLIFTFSLTEGLCSIEPIYLLFCQLYTGDLPYPFISFLPYSVPLSDTFLLPLCHSSKCWQSVATPSLVLLCYDVFYFNTVIYEKVF